MQVAPPARLPASHSHIRETVRARHHGRHDDAHVQLHSQSDELRHEVPALPDELRAPAPGALVELAQGDTLGVEALHVERGV
eukprot:222396-Pyramimonas_sp.AAC.1